MSSADDLQKLNRLLETLEKKRADGKIDDGVYRRLHSEYSARITELGGGAISPSPSLRGIDGPPIVGAAGAERPRILTIEAQQGAISRRSTRSLGENIAVIAIVAGVVTAVLLMILRAR